MARPRRARIEHRAPSLGGVLDVCAALGVCSGEPRPEPEAVTAETAEALLDALGVREPRSFADDGALVATARAAYVAWLDACAQAEVWAGVSVERVVYLTQAFPEAGERTGLELSMGSMPRADALAMWDAPLDVALRLMGWGATAQQLRDELDED